ncbi:MULTISPECIES: DUF5816 domain-containing protein [Salinibaculum]|uniref:DUF5816 domain-containing protein n=1 Tax=Salinibaculum TaxID=2732368 RepID=UPI0030D530C0
METVTAPEGETVYVDRREGKRGAKGPFYVVYTGEDRDVRWGFYCGNCDTLDNAVDAMGRVQCNRCSNRSKAEEWDAAHE